MRFRLIRDLSKWGFHYIFFGGILLQQAQNDTGTTYPTDMQQDMHGKAALACRTVPRRSLAKRQKAIEKCEGHHRERGLPSHSIRNQNLSRSRVQWSGTRTFACTTAEIELEEKTSCRGRRKTRVGVNGHIRDFRPYRGRR